MGCGRGGVLTEFLNFGMPPKKMHGVDLLFDRLGEASERLSDDYLINANGQELPYSSHSFDLVLQFTALSSILDETIRQAQWKFVATLPP